MDLMLDGLKNVILDHLKDDDVTTIILVGVAGVGKTWMAKKIREYAVSEGNCYAALWISMNVRHDRMSFYKNIASQLSLLSNVEELEDDDIDEEKEKNINLKDDISAKLQEKRAATDEEHKSLLLILDAYDGPETGELKDLLEMLKHEKSLKLLISRRRKYDDGQTNGNTREIRVEPLSREDDLKALLEKRVPGIAVIGQFSEAIVKKSMGMPVAIALIAEALNHIIEHDSDVWTLDAALEEAADCDEAVKDVSPLVHCAYEMLPGGVIADCFWHCRAFFHRYGGVHYNDLITHWIMEGFFDPITHVEEAYEQGHHVLMELMNRQMLKIQEDNIVILEGATESIVDHRRVGFSQTARLGLTSVVLDGSWKGFGRITPMDGMIKTLCSGTKWEKVCTLLIDGSRLLLEVPEKLFQRMKILEVLALFDLKLKSLPLSFSQLQNVHVLVLRDCDLLDNIDHISELKSLTVLEVSGASSLAEIQDDFFAQMTQLQSLNLSGSRVSNLPSTLSNLKELHWLILRRCVNVEVLPKIHELTKLEVLDLSYASSFREFHEKSFAIFEKLQILDLSYTQIVRLPFISELKELSRLLLRGCESLSRLPKLEQLPRLQILDLSYAKKLKEINALRFLNQSETTAKPSDSNVGILSELYLTGCSTLVELPCTEKFTGLRSIDLSGACHLIRFSDNSFNHLRLLHSIDLSKTKVKSLPSLSNLHNLRFLLLSDCSSLKTLEVKGLIRLKKLDLSGCICLDKLQGLSALQKLEVLDLSGCTALSEIEDQSFEHMSHLHSINLSETQVKKLPSMSSLNNLCHLRLHNCFSLRELPEFDRLTRLELLDLSGCKCLGEWPRLDALQKLEVLDLSDCTALPEMESLFEHMAQLQNLNLSQIKLKKFSFVSKLTILRRLSLKGCPNLKEVPSLEELTRLEVLDLSETDIGSLPCLDKLSCLHRLVLRKCSRLKILPSLKSLLQLEFLDLSGSGVREFPYDISDLTYLKHLDMGDLDVKANWEMIKRLPEEIIWGQFGISNPAKILENGKKPSIMVNGTKVFQILKERDSNFLETWLNQNFVCVCPPKEEADDGAMHHLRDELISNDAYFDIREFPCFNVRSMELCGFENFPTGVENVLEKAEYISLVGNGFMKSLSSLGSDSMTLKGCWLERCNKMENIFSDDGDVKLGGDLENIWVSNLINLRSLCSKQVGSLNFMKLQNLHLDSCPMLEDGFPSTSGLENLKTIKIKFCERLKSVFKCHGSEMCELKNLQEVHLDCCPMLEDSFPSTSGLENLQIIKIKFCDRLKTVFKCHGSETCELKNLREVHLDCCPMLEDAFPSTSGLENLQIIKIKFCDRLKTVFKIHGSDMCGLKNLQELHLLELPELESIGATCPPEAESDVLECPKLKLKDSGEVSNGQNTSVQNASSGAEQPSVQISEP